MLCYVNFQFEVDQKTADDPKRREICKFSQFSNAYSATSLVLFLRENKLERPTHLIRRFFARGKFYSY